MAATDLGHRLGATIELRAAFGFEGGGVGWAGVWGCGGGYGCGGGDGGGGGGVCGADGGGGGGDGRGAVGVVGPGVSEGVREDAAGGGC